MVRLVVLWLARGRVRLARGRVHLVRGRRVRLVRGWPGWLARPLVLRPARGWVHLVRGRRTRLVRWVHLARDGHRRRAHPRRV